MKRRSTRGQEQGQILALFGLSLLVMVSIAGLSIDAGGAYAQRRDQQSAADQLGLGPSTAVYLSALGEGQDDGDAGPGVTTPVELRSRPAGDG